MGGFIIGDKNACSRCGRVEGNGKKVTWICEGCRKFVCPSCALKDPTGREILLTTLCSENCRIAVNAERKLAGQLSVEEEEHD